MSEQKIKSGSGKGFTKTVYARLPPGSDLIQGIREVCETEGVDNGVIVCCIGSLEKAIFEYKTVAMDPNLAAGGPLVSDGPVSVLSCQGMVCRSASDGELSVHLHGCVQDNSGKVMGQHFSDEGNIVLATVDLVIADIGIELLRRPIPGIPGLVTTLKDE